MLYPRESETREIKDLSGIWKFKADKQNEGYGKKWFARPLVDTIAMPVPSSYNDITQDVEIKNHIGDVWYETECFIPETWKDKVILIHVGSATHVGRVWINGVEVGSHTGGHLPFECNVTAHARLGQPNRITIAVNNILTWQSIPPGEVITPNDGAHPKGYRFQDFRFDFFNYSGLHRPVKLVAVPRTQVTDIIVITDIKSGAGIIDHQVTVNGKYDRIAITIKDKTGNPVATGKTAKGSIRVPKAILWEPGKAYLYTFEIQLFQDESLVDSYRLPIGIRTVAIKGDKFLINNKPFYFKGFGKHEDADIRGKGLDHAINIKDFNLMKWMGANSFRTSHYPYSEELMNLADEEGLVVIDETPAVGMNYWRQKDIFCPERVNDKTLANHIQVMRELVARDKNHPCVVMWSVANEPASWEKSSGPYFKTLFAASRKLDATRPYTFVSNVGADECQVSCYADMLCINRYNSWYADSGHLELIEFQFRNDLLAWRRKFKKPILLAEYGADTIEGFHSDPPVMFTEEYQCAMLSQFHKVLDEFPFTVGEHVWAFSDFATKQETIRIKGNKKGVFNRQREPKAAAHMLRQRWLNFKK